MATKRDYYAVLEIERNASAREIQDAYRKLAIRFHPDRNPGDEEAIRKFKEAAEAFEVLNDDEKRARYDRFGHAGVNAGGGPHFGDINDIFAAFGDIFGDSVFGDIFGRGNRGGGRRRVRRGADVRADVELDLAEAARGVTKTVEFVRHRRCTFCEGTGAKPGSKPAQCQYCRGAGQVIESSGIFRVQTTCPSCHGSGQVIKERCTSCGGVAFVQETVKREVNIPPGVDDNMQLRMEGEGDPSPDGGPSGDCYCFISVRKHPLFERDGQNLICQVPITYAQAALGATIEVPTLDGREELEVPAGTQSGTVIRMKGRGVASPRRRGLGDLLVQLHIEVPKKLTPKHREILEQLAEEEHVNVSPHRKSFVDKLRDYFSFSDDRPEAEV